MGTQDVGDAAVEAFDHAVGLWGSGLGQAMLNAVVGADPIKDTGGGWLAFAGSAEAVGKRLAILGENLADREGALLIRRLMKPLAAVADFYVDPTGGGSMAANR